MKVLWKMLWYFVVFLDFFFSIVKLGKPNITVSHTIFLCCHFVFFFLMHYFKTINNFSPKICYKNAVDVKNKIIISNWDLPQLEIKKYCESVVTFCCVPRVCLVKFGEPKFIFLGTIFFNCFFFNFIL